MALHIVAFSKNRPLQCDLMLSSLKLNMGDYNKAKVTVIYSLPGTSNYQDRNNYDLAYNRLAAIHPEVSFLCDNAHLQPDFHEVFQSYFCNNMELSDHVMFTVDDCIYTHPFSWSEIHRELSEDREYIGCSLRLGLNIKYCYTMDQPQELGTYNIWSYFMRYRWTDADVKLDFAYPLEVSSSIYPAKILSRVVINSGYSNPNQLESVLAGYAPYFRYTYPYLLCYKTSRAFCNPINKVQTVAPNNRAGDKEKYSPNALLRRFLDGNIISPHKFCMFENNSVHQEVDL